jgi:hypothetical protein
VLCPDGKNTFYSLEKCINIASAALAVQHSACPRLDALDACDSVGYGSLHGRGIRRDSKQMEPNCLLGHYLMPNVDDSRFDHGHQNFPSGSISTRSLGYTGSDNPSIALAEQISSLLAFKRWSDTPVEKVSNFHSPPCCYPSIHVLI